MCFRGKWIWSLPLAVAVGLYGAAGIHGANAQQQAPPPAPPPDEAPPAPPPEQPPAPPPEQPPAPPPEEAPPAPAPEDPPPVPEDPPAPPPEEDLPPLEDPLPEPEAPAAPTLPDIDVPDPAAEVNGREISADLYSWVVDRMNEMGQHVMRPDDAPSHEAVAESLIDQKIFLIDAEREGAEVSEAEVDAAIDAEQEALIAPEVFDEMLEAEGLTEELYREKVEAQLMAREHTGNLAQEDEYGQPSPDADEPMALIPDDETALQLSGLVLDMSLDEHRVMEQRVEDVRDEFDTEIHIDLAAAEAAEPVEPAEPELPVEEPMPAPDLDEPLPAPEAPAPAPEAPAPGVGEPAPAPEAPDNGGAAPGF